jgi:hypothetical protein
MPSRIHATCVKRRLGREGEIKGLERTHRRFLELLRSAGDVLTIGAWLRSEAARLRKGKG